jgi:hypothetical protein
MLILLFSVGIVYSRKQGFISKIDIPYMGVDLPFCLTENEKILNLFSNFYHKRHELTFT